jgi:molybdenum cofactor cytidylyltransferase
MGRMKQLLLFGEETMLERSLSALCASRVDEIVVVLGHGFERILEAVDFSHPGVRVVLNRHYRQGLSSSIRAGMSRISPSAGAVLIALGDQPFVSPDVIDSLLERMNSGSHGIVVPVYRGRRGNPVLMSRKYFRLLNSLRGDEGGRSILAEHPDDVLRVEVGSSGVLRDFDTPEDLK